MKKAFLIFSFIALAAYTGRSQELNCAVQVTTQITNKDPKFFENLQIAIWEFMNNRKWTNHVFKNEERIECSVLINLLEMPNTDQYRGTIQIQSRRPVFKSSYSTTILNFLDKDFDIKWLENQPLDFTENSHLSNLTSVLAFYAYVVIGLDYDSFSPEGGTTFLDKAQTIVNNAQNAGEKGWKAFESTKNRYWLMENLMNKNYSALRSFIYKYNRLGMDVFADKAETARSSIVDGLDGLQKLNREKPGLFMMAQLMSAKSDELVNIFKEATPLEKTKVVPLLNEIDPGNVAKYKNINTTN
ncbi:MAG: DUF4835 family protein [Bacteroidota bacterium]